jgi:hypothetical protein
MNVQLKNYSKFDNFTIFQRSKPTHQELSNRTKSRVRGAIVTEIST